VLAPEVFFDADGPVEYIIDGDTYSADRHLRLAVGPKLRFVRLTGEVVSDGKPLPPRLPGPVELALPARGEPPGPPP
jgi:hypothetical protein